jgi:protein OS-9
LKNAGLASGAAPVQEKEYYSETYTGGTPCDVRELRRQSEIRFRCSEGDVSLIVDLKEPSTCQYLIDIETPLLCKHPKYRKKIDVAFPIRCVEFVPADDAVVATHPQLRRVVTPNKEKNLVIAQSGMLP